MKQFFNYSHVHLSFWTSAVSYAKSVIKKLLSVSGLELRKPTRSMSELLDCPRKATSGTIVEFVGTQGIGKSTLYWACQKQLEDRWFFRDDLSGLGPRSVDSGQVEQLHRDIVFRRMNRVDESGSHPWRSITEARATAMVVYESLLISTHPFPRGFMLEEGLFKNFPEEVLALNDDESMALWQNRAFVHLRARDPDLAVARFQKRAVDRRSRGIIQDQESDDDLRSRIETDNLKFDRMIEKAREFHRPSIVVYAEDDFAGAVKDVLEFEKSLNQ